MIFQGPPGTGKTYLAERMGRLLTGETAGFVETVQFHPSYSYEDFMQGIRPVVIDRQLIFQRMPGRFMQFCGRARRAHDDAPCVLIIDEIIANQSARTAPRVRGKRP
jgi:5-methylcytosine-specific restriction endonuclease McrBC GTP-binding regulatory subunit McrB